MPSGEERDPVHGAGIGRDEADALSWLARWMVLPFLAIVGLWFAEPLFRGKPKVEIVPTVTRQEVHPYPFPPGATGPRLAPPEQPLWRRQPPAPPPVAEAPAPSAPDIVARPLYQPQPGYPPRALEAEKQGLVRLRITIGPDGTVTDAIVLHETAPGWFDDAAVRTVRSWRYQPSNNVISTVVEIEFKLN